MRALTIHQYILCISFICLSWHRSTDIRALTGERHNFTAFTILQNKPFFPTFNYCGIDFGDWNHLTQQCHTFFPPQIIESIAMGVCKTHRLSDFGINPQK